MATSAPKMEDLTLSVALETVVKAPIGVTFESLLEQLGPLNETTDGVPLKMKLEAWPGGRWYRDLGDGNGHYWATVQAIKRPTLLEMCGPLFSSNPVFSNVQYRLSEAEDGTLIKFRHLALGFLDAPHREGVFRGWTTMLENAKKLAEKAGRQRPQ